MRLALLAPVVLFAAACGEVAGKPCTEAQLQCGEACIDPLANGQHCGRCDNACTGSQVCGNGQCADTCPDGQEACGGGCVDTQIDEEHCGNCTTECTASQECRGGSCQMRCDASLMSPITDPWGFAWDGLERTAASLDVATTNCAAFGARLPTATELYRVSATRTGAVGQSFHTNPLWTQVPADRLNQATLRLSDGTTSTAAAASSLTYRCVCPAAAPPAFTGSRCNGAPGSECTSVGRYNIDTADRPALRKASAVWECANERAHLADFPMVVEAIHAGAPGSNAYIVTGDHWSHTDSVGVRWTTAASWAVNGNILAMPLATAAPFRCAGPSFVAGTHSATVANEFVGPLGAGYKGETVDTAASAWAAAHDTCFNRGGHIPRAHELAELIQQGLPSGSNAFLWTSDQTGYNGVNNFMAAVLRWQALDRRFPYDAVASSQLIKTVSIPVRCVYYPTDPSYTPPATCNGPCFAVDLPVGPGRMVFDSTDRTAATLAVAFDTCRQAGGHLPSERDYTEAIRRGLPNGTGPGTSLLTSDITYTPNVTIVRWANVNTAFADQFSADMTWAAVTAALPYRCMWTNEVR